MSRRQRLVVNLITVLPVVVMLVWGVVYVYNQFQYLVGETEVFIEDELSRRLNREVGIGDSKVTSLGHIILRDVRISEGKTLDQGELIYAKKVFLDYNWRELFYRGNLAGSINRITILEPSATIVRRPDGRLNIQDLIAPAPPTAKPFTGIVTVINGRFDWIDYAPASGATPVRIRLGELRGRFSAARLPLFIFNITAKGRDSSLRDFALRGAYDAKGRVLQADIDTSAASAAKLSQYIRIPRGIAILGGRADASFGIQGAFNRPRNRYSITGAARLMDVSVKAPFLRTPVRSIYGRVALSGQEGALNLRGRAAGSAVSVSGRFSGLSRPRVDLLLRSGNVDIKRLFASLTTAPPTAGLQPAGSGSVTARITGRLANPIVEFRIKSPRIDLDGYDIRNVTASGQYFRSTVRLSTLKAVFNDADVALQGLIRLRPEPGVSLRGEAAGVDIAKLGIFSNLRASGIADIAFTATGSLKAPQVRASAEVRRGSVAGVPFESASASFIVSEGRADISKLRITRVPGEAITVSGGISPDIIDLDIQAQGVNLADIGATLGVGDIRGIAFFTGRIVGSPRAPTVIGMTEVFRGGYREYDIDYAVANFTSRRGVLTIEEAVVNLFPAEIRFSGTVNELDTERPTYDISGSFDRMTVAKLSALTKRDINAAGIIRGEFAASGAYLKEPLAGGARFVDTVASAEIELEDGQIMGQLVETATSKLDYRDGVVYVTETSIGSEGAALALSGIFSVLDNRADLEFTLDNFDLTRIREQLNRYVVASGVGSAKGTLTGVWPNVVISASGSIDRLTIGDKRFDQAQFTADYFDGLVADGSIILRRGSQSYDLKVRDMNPATLDIDSLSGRIANVSVPELYDIMIESPYFTSGPGMELRRRLVNSPGIASGVVDAEFQISGNIARPEGRLDLVATNIGIDVRQIDRITLDVTASGGLVTLNNLSALSGDTVVTATGTLGLDNRVVDADVTARNVDLVGLRPWLGQNTPGGVMAADFVVRGNLESPQIIGSVEIVKPTFRTVVFDSLRISRIEFFPNRFELSDVILARGRHQAVARGTLPWDWSTLSIPEDRPLDVTAELRREDLSILADFAPLINANATSGPIDASLSVTGTLSSPVVNGSLRVTDGIVSFTNFKNRFENVNIDVVFDGSRAVVNQFSAISSLGGSVGMEPGSYLTVSGPRGAQINALVFADNMATGWTNLLGIQEDINMVVDAGLSMTGDVREPLITDSKVGRVAGGIRISNGRLSFQIPRGLAARSGISVPFNPTFDISIAVGPDVRIIPPQMELLASGEGTLRGTLSNPDLAVNLTVDEGRIRLAVSRLRVTPGGTIAVRYRPPEEPEVRVGLQAQTSVSATSPLGRRERYQISLNVSGPIDDLEIDLSSDPGGLSREQMLAALGHVEGIFSSGELELERELVNVLTAVGTSTLFAPIEELFVEELGFEQFTLEYGAVSPFTLYISRRLVGNFYVSYFQILNSATGTVFPVYSYQFNISYRFSPEYQFSLGYDDQQTVTAIVNLRRAFN